MLSLDELIACSDEELLKLNSAQSLIELATRRVFTGQREEADTLLAQQSELCITLREVCTALFQYFISPKEFSVDTARLIERGTTSIPLPLAFLLHDLHSTSKDNLTMLARKGYLPAVQKLNSLYTPCVALDGQYSQGSFSEFLLQLRQ